MANSSNNPNNVPPYESPFIQTDRLHELEKMATQYMKDYFNMCEDENVTFYFKDIGGQRVQLLSFSLRVHHKTSFQSVDGTIHSIGEK